LKEISLKLTVDFSQLYEAVRIMNAEEIEFNIDNILTPRDKIDIQLSEGIELDIREIDFDNGLASYKGRQVLLYIKDHGWNIETALQFPEKGKKFHVANCSTLVKMRREGRFDRYVVTNNLSGLFDISGTSQISNKTISGQAPLKVCKNCLEYLNFQGYKTNKSKRHHIFNSFKIADFFDTFSSLFQYSPSGIANTTSTNYTKDWSKISSKLKASMNYTCEICKVNMRASKSLLHVHHINGVKGDNSKENLIVVCADCHKKQPCHDSMFISHKDTKIIGSYRSQQGLSQTTSWNDVSKYTDASLLGLVDILQREGFPLPNVREVIFSPTEKTNFIVELSWNKSKVGICIDTTVADKLKPLGWKIHSMADCLNNIDSLKRAMRYQ